MTLHFHSAMPYQQILDFPVGVSCFGDEWVDVEEINLPLNFESVALIRFGCSSCTQRMLVCGAAWIARVGTAMSHIPVMAKVCLCHWLCLTKASDYISYY